jgi:hypothetical protein
LTVTQRGKDIIDPNNEDVNDWAREFRIPKGSKQFSISVVRLGRDAIAFIDGEPLYGLTALTGPTDVQISANGFGRNVLQPPVSRYVLGISGIRGWTRGTSKGTFALFGGEQLEVSEKLSAWPPVSAVCWQPKRFGNGIRGGARLAAGVDTTQVRLWEDGGVDRLEGDVAKIFMFRDADKFGQDICIWTRGAIKTVTVAGFLIGDNEQRPGSGYWIPSYIRYETAQPDIPVRGLVAKAYVSP